MNVAVLASGRGTNLRALLQACAAGAVPARVCLVLSDRPGAPALGRGRAAGVPCRVLAPRDFPQREAHDRALAEACRAAGAGLVVLAGYMRLLGPAFLEPWAGRCINVHPSLLPAFAGGMAPEPQRQALEYGVKLSGCTVHLVTADVDAGPILAQASVPVLPADTVDSLSGRILAEEHRLLPAVLRQILAGRLIVNGRQAAIWPETCC